MQKGKRIACEDGGVTLFVAESLSRYFVTDHSCKEFPEVVAVEFRGSLFGVESNVVIMATYISCSELPASKR